MIRKRYLRLFCVFILSGGYYKRRNHCLFQAFLLLFCVAYFAQTDTGKIEWHNGKNTPTDLGKEVVWGLR